MNSVTIKTDQDASLSADDPWRPLRVVRIVDESAVIRSFHLEPIDGLPLAPYAAGQHLPIRLTIPGHEAPVLRTYTLSSASLRAQYRLSVRKLGTGSSFLHESVVAGDIIEARAPAGSFTIDAELTHPVVFMAAGVGITPMLAMLDHLVAEGERTGHMRPATLFYAARAKRERAFDFELAALRARAKAPITLVRLLQMTDDADPGTDYEETDMIRADLIKKYLSFDRYDFYLCGPPGFMQAAYTMLRGLGVADPHIRAEAFGPASLVRTTDSPEAVSKAEPSDVPVAVVFNRAGDAGIWSSDKGSLLEFAEASGLTPAFGCRVGVCGACRTTILSGTVAYIRDTTAACGPGEVLICSAVPARVTAGQPNALGLDIRQNS